jgi:putative IMPACT (imprinted ancient) family translation regulator
MSDAGEPHGTAGRPMLTTLLHSGVGEIVAVCSRWFGGVKLGTGRLSRAYSSGVKLALASLPTVERVERVLVEVIVGYAAVGEVQRALAALGALVESEQFGADARIRCRVPVAALPALRRSVADLTRGGGAVGEI